ncbi:hypothetical protein AGMMS49975_09270 [Clostridia bacterium]|nr:hypothetical protein AGMMS49975_09270 [Clostridia bacterium]
MTIGDRIRVCRAKQRMTQKALSKSTGIPEITLRGYESNKFVPKEAKIEKIAEALGMSVEDLCNRKKRAEPPPETPDDVRNLIISRIMSVLFVMNTRSLENVYEILSNLSMLAKYQKDNEF